MKVREVIKLIEQDGWYLARTRGSHRQFKHPTKSGNCRAVEGSDRSPYPLSDRYQNPYHLEQLDNQHPKVKCSQQPLPSIHTMN
jgi:hypothetical protein